MIAVAVGSDAAGSTRYGRRVASRADPPSRHPLQLGWRRTRSLWSELNSCRVFDWAAALTYYGVLSLGPALVVAVALLGLVGGAPTLLDQVADFAPGAARDTLVAIISDVRRSSTGSGIALVVGGLAMALWSASGYVGAYGRACRAMRSGGTSGSGVRQAVRQVSVTLLIFLFVFVIAVMVVVSGPLAEKTAKLVGLGKEFPKIWALAKWPAVLGAMAVVDRLLSAASGSLKAVRRRVISMGSVVAITIWVLLSVAFSIYVSSFSSYSRVYGSLAGVVIFLVWMWLSNVSLLVGVLVDVRRERRSATIVR